jgi:hypothetical protein
MSGIALGAAFAAVQLVHRAHSKVKTSKARCARLVERCQFVVDRLERIAATEGGGAIVRGRIHELERCAEWFSAIHSRASEIDDKLQGFRTDCADHSPSWPAGRHRVPAAIRGQRIANRILQ